MKTKEQILSAIQAGRKSACIDDRDYSRLCDFFSTEDWGTFGFAPKEGATWTPIEFTYENVLKQLKSDVEFGFEKALNQRGISASLMYEVVKMWMWVLDDDLANFDDYAMYGLPLFKAVALKYDFDNPIGDDNGDETKYESHL